MTNIDYLKLEFGALEQMKAGDKDGYVWWVEYAIAQLKELLIGQPETDKRRRRTPRAVIVFRRPTHT
jgi:hypothetical protein